MNDFPIEQVTVDEEVCPLCGNSGLVWSDEDDGEGNVIGTKRCPHLKQSNVYEPKYND